MEELIPPAGPRDHHLGRLDAAIVLVEYGDYECPDSVAAYAAVEELRADVGPQLCFVYRHFPLVAIHHRAIPAGEAAEAAGAQGRFWDMHAALYRTSPALDLDDFVVCAEDLDLDVARFGREIRSNLHLPRVRQDMESGQHSKVTGTPTFFVNGLRHHGGCDLDSLLKAIRVLR